MDASKLIDSHITSAGVGGSDQKKAWNNFWNRSLIQNILDIARRYETKFYIKNILAKYVNTNCHFCELGCGTAILLRSISPYCKKVIALDYSEDSLRIAKKVFNDANIKNYELIKQDIRDSHHIKARYDIVFSNGLIEHFKEPHIALSAHLKYLKPGGVAIILAPYKYSFKYFWFKLTDNKLLKKFWLWTEQYFFTANSMKAEVNKISPSRMDWYKISTLHNVENILLVIKKT